MPTLDLTRRTGLRFHPLEIFLSLGLQSVGGPLPRRCALGSRSSFEILLNASSVFNHGNVRIPESVDRWLRCIVVTPDMHRIHHSTRVVETNSNFGFSVSWWDRLCGTYRPQPALGQLQMEIGLREYRTPLHLGQLLVLPFQGDARRYPLADARPIHV